VRFTGVLYYDAQAVLVPAGSAIRTPDDLAGATVCTERGTTHEANLARRLEASGRAFAPSSPRSWSPRRRSGRGSPAGPPRPSPSSSR